MPHRVAYASLAARKIRALQLLCQDRHFIAAKSVSDDGESVGDDSFRDVFHSLGDTHLMNIVISLFTLTSVKRSAMILKIRFTVAQAFRPEGFFEGATDRLAGIHLGVWQLGQH